MTAPVRTWSTPLTFRTEQCPAVDYTNNIVYVFPSTSANAVKKTLDNGVTWTDLTTAPLQAWNSGFVTSTGRVLGFSSSGTYCFSDDYGATWTTTTTAFPASINCCDQTSDGSIYFGCYDSHIYKSVNNGLTWTDTSNNIPVNAQSLTVSCIRHTSSGIIWASIGTSTGNSNSNMYYSSDNGASWSTSGYGGYAYTQFALIGSRYYAPIFDTSYVFNGTTGSYTGADVGLTKQWWGCFPDNDGRYYLSNYARQVYSTTNFSLFTLEYTATWSGAQFSGIVDAKDNIWISGDELTLGSVPAVTPTKQLYIYSNATWKPVTSAYVGVNGTWKLATPYGGINSSWK